MTEEEAKLDAELHAVVVETVANARSYVAELQVEIQKMAAVPETRFSAKQVGQLLMFSSIIIGSLLDSLEELLSENQRLLAAAPGSVDAGGASDG